MPSLDDGTKSYFCRKKLSSSLAPRAVLARPRIRPIAILLEQGHHVRAMVRKLHARADALLEMGAEVVVADMLDIIAVRAAMQGCSGVYFTMSILPTYLEATTNVTVAAKSTGVRAFVNLRTEKPCLTQARAYRQSEILKSRRLNPGQPSFLFLSWRGANFSFPEDRARQVDEVAVRESRNISELFREASECTG